MVTFKQLLEEIGKVIVYKSAVTEYSVVLKDLTYDACEFVGNAAQGGGQG